MPYKNQEDARRRAKERYQEKHDEILAKVKAHYDAHKEEISERRRANRDYGELYWKNRPLALQRKKKYDQSEKGKQHRRKYEKDRLQNDEAFIKKKRARDIARHAVAVGVCEKCGKTEKLHRHHPDYNKPLDVKVLCYDCHLTEHGRRRVQ